MMFVKIILLLIWIKISMEQQAETFPTVADVSSSESVVTVNPRRRVTPAYGVPFWPPPRRTTLRSVTAMPPVTTSSATPVTQSPVTTITDEEDWVCGCGSTMGDNDDDHSETTVETTTNDDHHYETDETTDEAVHETTASGEYKGKSCKCKSTRVHKRTSFGFKNIHGNEMNNENNGGGIVVAGVKIQKGSTYDPDADFGDWPVLDSTENRLNVKSETVKKIGEEPPILREKRQIAVSSTTEFGTVTFYINNATILNDTILPGFNDSTVPVNVLDEVVGNVTESTTDFTVTLIDIDNTTIFNTTIPVFNESTALIVILDEVIGNVTEPSTDFTVTLANSGNFTISNTTIPVFSVSTASVIILDEVIGNVTEPITDFIFTLVDIGNTTNLNGTIGTIIPELNASTIQPIINLENDVVSERPITFGARVNNTINIDQPIISQTTVDETTISTTDDRTTQTIIDIETTALARDYINNVINVGEWVGADRTLVSQGSKWMGGDNKIVIPRTYQPTTQIIDERTTKRISDDKLTTKQMIDDESTHEQNGGSIMTAIRNDIKEKVEKAKELIEDVKEDIADKKEAVSSIKEKVADRFRNHNWLGVLLATGASVTASILVVQMAVLPLVFKYSKTVQRKVVFSNFINYPRNLDYDSPSSSNIIGGRNFSIQFQSKEDDCPIKLGAWHLLPCCSISRKAMDDDPVPSGTWQNLRTTRNKVVLYCHGNSNHRASPHRLAMYKVFQELNFHVITFDYRGYGDSTSTKPTERGVVEDLVQMYSWLIRALGSRNRPSVLLWGHSLGTAVAANMVAHLPRLCNKYNLPDLPQPDALVLEAPFNNLLEEIECHPFSKCVSWLPYYKESFVKPFTASSEYAFNTDQYLTMVPDLPILMLHCRGDKIVPYDLAVKLYDAVHASRNAEGAPLVFHSFEKGLGLGHNNICEATGLRNVVMNFLDLLKTSGSDESD